MILRKTTYADIDAVMEIIHTAQRSLCDGGVNQWQNNYPNSRFVTGMSNLNGRGERNRYV